MAGQSGWSTAGLLALATAEAERTPLEPAHGTMLERAELDCYGPRTEVEAAVMYALDYAPDAGTVGDALELLETLHDYRAGEDGDRAELEAEALRELEPCAACRAELAARLGVAEDSRRVLLALADGDRAACWECGRSAAEESARELAEGR